MLSARKEMSMMYTNLYSWILWILVAIAHNVSQISGYYQNTYNINNESYLWW